MKTILNILENGGFLTEESLAELAATFPQAKVVVKWQNSPRSIGAAVDVIKAIEKNEKNDYDYAREVFFSCESYDALCKALGFKRELHYDAQTKR